MRVLLSGERVLELEFSHCQDNVRCTQLQTTLRPWPPNPADYNENIILDRVTAITVCHPRDNFCCSEGRKHAVLHLFRDYGFRLGLERTDRAAVMRAACPEFFDKRRQRRRVRRWARRLGMQVVG